MVAAGELLLFLLKRVNGADSFGFEGRDGGLLLEHVAQLFIHPIQQAALGEGIDGEFDGLAAGERQSLRG